MQALGSVALTGGAEREEVLPEPLDVVDDRAPRRAGDRGRALRRHPHGHAGEHHEAAEGEGTEQQARAPRGDARRQRTGGGHAQQAARRDEVFGRRVQARSPAGQVEQPASGHREHEAADPQVRARRRVGVGIGIVVGLAPHQDDPGADQGERNQEPTPAHEGADGAVQPAADGAGEVGVDAHAGDDPDGDAEQAADVVAVPAQAGGQDADEAVEERGRGRGRALAGGRPLRPPAAGPLGGSHSGHNRTSSPTSHRSNKGHSGLRSARPPPDRWRR